MADVSRYDHIVIDRYRYRGFYGCQSWCGLEILAVADKRIVIATELEDNPGIPTWGYPWGYPKNVKDNHSQVGLSLKNWLMPFMN